LDPTRGSLFQESPIKDIIVSPGQFITFTPGFDLNGLPAVDPATAFLDFTYWARYDSSELQPTDGGPDTGIRGRNATVALNGTCVAGNGCDPLKFLVTDPVDDGVFDFSYELRSIIELDANQAVILAPNPSVDWLAIFPLTFDERGNPGNKFNQVVEVQPVPGPLPILGITAAFGFSRKLRKRIKTRKTPEAISVIS
jgi:hypothetical protein